MTDTSPVLTFWMLYMTKNVENHAWPIMRHINRKFKDIHKWHPCAPTHTRTRMISYGMLCNAYKAWPQFLRHIILTLTSPYPNLLVPKTKLGSDKYQFHKSLVWLSWDSNSLPHQKLVHRFGHRTWWFRKKRDKSFLMWMTVRSTMFTF